ncbi:MAG TPA: peptide chain release factor N(5)-glutamine methyltransferase [Gemmatimonadales bacterium]|nr:peptide chain release factor N(5)-glutamine methyltransferase [Gemmatimonadales bacterium]
MSERSGGPTAGPSVGALLADATRRLAGAGLGEPRRAAVRIWADLAGAEPGGTFLQAREAVAPETAERFVAAVERRAGGEPLPYVTGCAGFRRLTLRADRRALIPRPETEGLVDVVLGVRRGGVVADIGTGSGCIALSLATEGSYDEVLALDCSAEALALAAENRELADAGRVRLVRSDLTQALAAASLDVLVSNPPYLTDGEYERLDDGVARWEPREALAAGPDGLRHITGLLHDGRRVLKPGGWLALEVDSARARTAAALAHRLGWTSVQIVMDLFGRERYLLARRSDSP